MNQECKDALLEEATKRFPSGCSYRSTSGRDRYNVYGTPVWWTQNSIALKAGKGLIYDNGVWATRIDGDGNEIPYEENNNPQYEIY